MTHDAEARERAGQVKAYAAELGFDACGIASAYAPIDPNDRLGQWLAQGFQADMDWMARTKAMRQDVQQRLPGCQSVVVAARNYYSERPPKPEGAAVGRVSNYAWGRDYHRVLDKPMKRLAQFISELQGEGPRARYSVDAQPVLEKAWAERAGIGWQGKNSLILRKGLGSYFFLGAVLTTLPLAPDPPALDACGSCTACLDACPTDAIVAAKVVDSNKCISYQTIENRGEVPEAIAQKHGDWVFGCDICQEVCPYNRKAPVTDETGFHPRENQAWLRLDRIKSMTDEDHRAQYRGTPLMRPKAAGLRRNAHII